MYHNKGEMYVIIKEAPDESGSLIDTRLAIERNVDGKATWEEEKPFSICVCERTCFFKCNGTAVILVNAESFQYKLESVPT